MRERETYERGLAWAHVQVLLAYGSYTDGGGGQPAGKLFPSTLLTFISCVLQPWRGRWALKGRTRCPHGTVFQQQVRLLLTTNLLSNLLMVVTTNLAFLPVLNP